MTKAAPAPAPTPFPSAAPQTEASDVAMVHGQLATALQQLKLTTRNRDVFQKKYTEVINQNLGLEERILELEEEIKMMQSLNPPTPIIQPAQPVTEE